MNTEKTLRQIVVTGLYLALLMPFVYVSGTIFPFVVGKIIYFQVMIELVAVFYILLAVINPSYRPKKTLILWLMVAHLGAWILAGIFGISPLRSFWGNFERMSGIFSYAHFVVYFIILVSVMRNKKSWVAYLVTALFISTIQSFVAIAQYYATSPILYAEPHGRVWGTLGNYIYLAGYTMMHIFLGLFVLSFIKRKEMRFWIWLMMVINLFAFLLAQTRGAYLGMAIGLAVMLAYLGWNLKNKKVRIAIVSIFVLGALLGAWTRTNSPIVARSIILRTFQNIKLSEGKGRFIAWNIALEGFLERPILGWGPDTYYFVFNKLYKPESLLNSYYETWFDRSHNIFLDELATTGAVGMIAYLGLAAVLFLGVHEIKKKYNFNTLSIAALYGLLTSYYIANFFVFDNAASFLLFALIAALIAGFGIETPEGSTPSRPVPASLVIVLILAALTSIYLYTLRPFMLASEVLQAEVTAQTNLVEAFTIYKNSYERGGPLRDEILAGMLRVAVDKAGNQDTLIKNNLADLKEIYEFSKKLEIYRPMDVYTWMTLGQFATILGTAEPKYYDEAEKYFSKAIEFSPKRQQLYYSWVKTKVMRGDINGALALLDKVEKLEPRVPDTYWYRGLIYSDIGQTEEAVKWMLKARTNDPAHPYSWKNMYEPISLAQLLDKTGRYDLVPRYLLEALDQAGDNQDILLALVKSYVRVNDQENARKYLLRLLELNPKNTEAFNLLQSLTPLPLR